MQLTGLVFLVAILSLGIYMWNHYKSTTSTNPANLHCKNGVIVIDSYPEATYQCAD
jgi:hypothetical protein